MGKRTNRYPWKAAGLASWLKETQPATACEPEPAPQAFIQTGEPRINQDLWELLYWVSSDYSFLDPNTERSVIILWLSYILCNSKRALVYISLKQTFYPPKMEEKRNQIKSDLIWFPGKYLSHPLLLLMKCLLHSHLVIIIIPNNILSLFSPWGDDELFYEVKQLVSQ